jgi:hypothetical protein
LEGEKYGKAKGKEDPVHGDNVLSAGILQLSHQK